MIEKLYCENGQHWFQRESKRGRKPTNCSEHMPTPAPKSAAELNEAGERKLICEHDGHEWWAPVQRGRPPRFCPDHNPNRKKYSYPFELETQTEKDAAWKRQQKAEKDLLVPVKAIPIGAEPRILMSSPPKAPIQIESVIEAAPTLREVYCHEGEHTWLAPIKRGKPPRNCAKHAVKGAIERKGELDQQKKEMAQEALQESIEHLSARVAAAEIVDGDAMAKLIATGGADDADEGTFKQWLRANSNLLHEVEALRSRERKLYAL